MELASADDRTEAEQRFVAAYQDNYAVLFAYFLRRLGSHADAADATAETFTVAWRRLDRMPESDQRPWFYGVARRVLANHVRGQRRRSALDRRLQGYDRPAAAQDDATFVREALDRLSASDSEILRLAAWEGMTAGEIAATLHLPASVVSVRLHRARKRLRSLIGESAAGGATRPGALRIEEAP